MGHKCFIKLCFLVHLEVVIQEHILFSDLHSVPSTITRVVYTSENSVSRLLCHSIYSPPANVSLVIADRVIVTLRDGESVTVAGVQYELMQTLTNRTMSAYASTLSIGTIVEGDITEYRCTVNNALGSDSKAVGEGSEFEIEMT